MASHDRPVFCPQCESENIRRRGFWVNMSIGTAAIVVSIVFIRTLVLPYIFIPFGLFFIVVFGLKGKNWKCKDCGRFWTERDEFVKSQKKFGD